MKNPAWMFGANKATEIGPLKNLLLFEFIIEVEYPSGWLLRKFLTCHLVANFGRNLRFLTEVCVTRVTSSNFQSGLTGSDK